MADAEPDPYSVLGVPRAALAADIRVAYRALVAKYHPDRHEGNPLADLASARMAEVNRAYEILSDPRRRAAYDARTRPAGASGGEGGATDRPSPTRPGAGGPPSVSRLSRQFLGLLLLIPLVVRFGALIARVLAAAVRGLFEATAGLRGTPAAGVAVLAAAAAVAWVVVRRRRSGARRKSR